MIEAPPVQGAPRSSAAGVLSRRNFLTLGASSVAGLVLYAGEIERHEIDLVPRTITLAGLPEPFVGFRIVQLSDIHLKEFTESMFLREVVRRINSLHPDLVALTGDFISNGPFPEHLSVGWAYRCAEILSTLTCPLRYAVLGNHDALVSARAVTDALGVHGIPVLSNRSVAIEREGQRFWLAGVADALEQKPDLSSALPSRAKVEREPVILLLHEPDFADVLVNRGISLVLSGHTHGGQVRIPFMRPFDLPALGRRYLEGHFLLGGGMQLYVNRGIGTVGVPFRFRCPPEITVITLAQARSTSGSA